MFQQRSSGPVLLLFILLGLAGGIGLGLLVAWVAWPTSMTNVDVADLKETAQDDYIVLTASNFAFDRDLSKARQRLDRLHAKELVDRLGELARGLTDEGKPEAQYVASLAVAMGNLDKDLAQIAATPTPTPTSTPFPTAPATRIVPTITPLSTLAPTPTNTFTPLPRTPTPTRTQTPRRISTTPAPKTSTPTRAAPVAPRPTDTPVPVAQPAGIQWLPAYPSGWPGGVYTTGAAVAPGQKYWKIRKAIYCDYQDDRNGCASMAGGPEQAGTWIMIEDEYGGRAEAPLFIGSGQSTDVKSKDDMCQCNYTFPVTNAPIYLGGFPSDTIGGMGLVSLKLGFSDKGHVRYFVWFQKATR